MCYIFSTFFYYVLVFTWLYVENTFFSFRKYVAYVMGCNCKPNNKQAMVQVTNDYVLKLVAQHWAFDLLCTTTACTSS